MTEIDMCRICANFTNSISSTNLFDRKQRCLLAEIQEITGCALKNAKNFPKFVCEYCEESLKQAVLFRKRCQDSQQYFNSAKYKEFLLKKPEDEVEVEPINGEVLTDFLENNQHICDNDADEQIDVKENIKNILFEPDNKVIKAILKENADDASVDEEKMIDESDGHSSDDITLSRLIKVEKSDELNIGNQKPNKKKGKKKKVANSKVQRKIKEKIQKEKTVNDKVDFMCDQCGNHFTCRHHFMTHLRRHANDKRYHCELCEAKFFTNSEIKRHMRRHTGERPFECQFCKRRFTDYSTRIKHERTHTNERPFKCEQCGKAFTTSYVLKNHMLVHTGERSFKCEICNKAFQRQVHLDVHYRSISHQQMKEKSVPNQPK